MLKHTMALGIILPKGEILIMRSAWFISLIILLALFATGCGSKQETAEDAVSSALQALAKYDLKVAGKYFDHKQFLNALPATIIGDKTRAVAFKNLNHKILSSSQNGDRANVVVEITNSALGNMLSEWVSESMGIAMEAAFSGGDKPSDEISAQRFQAMLDRHSGEIHMAEVEIKLQRSGKGWRLDIEGDRAVQDAIFGGIHSVYDEWR